MDSQTPHEADEADDRVMTGDGSADRKGPKPAMTAQGAVVGDDDPEDMVMTGDGAEPRRAPKPRMTAGGAVVDDADDEQPGA